MKTSTRYIVGGVVISIAVLVVILGIVFIVRRPAINSSSNSSGNSSSGAVGSGLAVGTACSSQNCISGAFCAAQDSTTGVCALEYNGAAGGSAGGACLDNPNCNFGLTCQFGTCQPYVQSSDTCSEVGIRKCTAFGAADCLPASLGYKGTETCQWADSFNNSTCANTFGILTSSFSPPLTDTHPLVSECITQVSNLDNYMPVPCTQQGLNVCGANNATFCINAQNANFHVETCQWNNDTNSTACADTEGQWGPWTGFANLVSGNSCVQQVIKLSSSAAQN